jgi:flagellar biosynthesis protein FliR
VTTVLENIAGLASGQVQLAGLAFIRIASMVALLPVIGSTSLPRQVKAGISLALLLCIFPTLPKTTAIMPDSVWGFASLAMREAAVGLIAGWSFALIFQVMEFAGAVIDIQAGFSMVELFDPTTGESTHLFGQFLGISATVTFLAAGGHTHLVAALADSFRQIPLATAHVEASRILPDVSALVVRSINLGLQMSGPVLMALLMLTLTMSVISRIMPSMNTWLVVMPLQVVVACALTGLSLPFVLRVFQGWQDDVFRTTGAILLRMR